MGKLIPPQLNGKSFSCPHCGAIAHQTWFKLFVEGYENDSGPWIPSEEVIHNLENDRTLQDKTRLIAFFKRKLAGQIFRETYDSGHYSRTELVNLYVSLCYSCDEYAVWIADKLIYPSQPFFTEPNEEMPAEIRADFLEASAIVDQSPRGAAALLRLSIQKLMAHLGLKGRNVDDDIGALVKQGLDGRIQKSLDVVRVVGNKAVHPGQIDLRDDKAMAVKLFNLVNLIVEATIATPKHIQAMYDGLPESALKAIEKRDGGTKD